MTGWDGAGYHAIAVLQRHLATRALAGLAFDGRERVLDVGCGDGAITATVAGRVPRGLVLGVDPSLRMLEYAERHGRDHRTLRFAGGDARALPVRSGWADVAVSFNALHWVPAFDLALREIGRVLAPDGRAVLQQVPATARASLEDVIERTARAPRWGRHFAGWPAPFRHPTPDAFVAAAAAAGLAVTTLTCTDERWDFGSRDAFTAFARVTFVAWTSRLPDAGRDAFIAEVLDAYRAVLADPVDADAFRFAQLRVELQRR